MQNIVHSTQDTGQDVLAQVPLGQRYNSPVYKASDIGSLVSSLASNLYIIAGIVLFALFIWGGLQMIRAAGGGNPEDFKKGRTIIFGALLGFLLIFSSYWIIQLIEKLTNLTIF